ncbi:MAG: serine protease [Planctomycetia bacterium]
MRTAARPIASLHLAACLAALASLTAAPACGQGLPWGWGAAGNPTATWSPEAVADYLHTGQPPHPAICRIVAPEQAGTSLGSGVLVDVNRAQGLVLTNWHVIRESRAAVLVQFPDGFQSAGTVIRWDEAWDLAAIVIWKPNATPVSLAGADPAPGERLTIAGFGRGSYREESGPCTEYLSPGSGHPKQFVELQATARQGDSGGAIFNDRRELAGVLFGQNEGRTIGSCATRLRTFLAAAGSRGFTPTPIAEFSDARAVDRAIGQPVQPPVQLASAVDGSIQRSTYVPGALPALQPGMPSAPFAVGAPPSGDLWAAVRPVLDPFANGPALLATAGGLALVFLGLRTMFGGRRRPPVNASESW